ncbi:Cell division cycle protein isoform 1 [Schistosoma japonicum]|uniref:Cell division cycle protein isoform 1 n=2 Tax=Schistosoma japonicum TaxID=6182 RepID=A0A4Z2DIV4_SCHJA|nr:Cell division cycle protein isoform 1 [Schistosoma japonicum]
MKIVDVKRCAFNSWYHTFESYTQDSVFIDLPEDVIASLTNGEFILPKSAKETNGRLSDRSDDDDWSDGSDTDENHRMRPEFPQFESHLKNIIQDLGGVVFPKLNWSAPCDASWMSCDGSLKCKTFSDIYLLLKSSDFAAHDLTAPFALCTDTSVEQTCCLFNSKPILVLRKWYDFRPEGEFRCFIKSKLLIAICQRKCDAYFKSIEEHIEDIRHDLMEFFNKKIKNRFHLEDYTVDLYREPSNDSKIRIQIIDFNVFGPPTESLLFHWSEFEDNAYEKDVIPTFRYQNDQNIRPNSVNQYSVPIDLVDIASGSDHTKLIDFIQAKVESQKQSQGRVCT